MSSPDRVEDGAQPRDTVFPELDVSAVVRQLRDTGLFTGFQLPPELIDEIRTFGESEEADVYLDGQFHDVVYPEISKLSSTTGKKILTAHLRTPDESCGGIGRLCADRKLLEIATAYMNGSPKRIVARLWWSFAVEASVDERLAANQTVLFHYDLEGFQFVYFSFYITPVDEDTGPHVTVVGTHKKKRWQHLWSSANCSDLEVARTYGEENVLTLTGEPGYGFVEDTFCFHKAVAPTLKNRLLLQIRMSY